MSGSVTFLTLFLNLFIGPHPVTVAVEGAVARVELLLDGESVGFLDGEPWTLTCEFGEALAPHELVAIGYDRDGREAARAKQLINLPRAEAEARLALDGGGEPPRAARLIWDTVENLEPQSIRVRFDDQPIAFDRPDDIRLPSYDPRQPHFLSAELTFTDEIEARTLASFGGALGVTTSIELTAVPIVAERKARPPAPAAMAGWFFKGDQPISAFAVEKTPADVLMVVDHAAWEVMRRVDGPDALTSRGNLRAGVPTRLSLAPRKWYPAGGLPSGLRKGDRFRFVTTFPTLLPGGYRQKLIFPISQDVSQEQRREIAWLMLRVTPPEKDRPQALAYAVAVAGRTAAAGERPRAVILVVTEDPEDVSGFSPENVRGYLDKLRVPLHVWRTSETSSPEAWGPSSAIVTPQELKEALKDLRSNLDRQWVVWLEGSHLPQDLELRHDAWKIAD
jgi:hypothetical protein